ncbi:MAG: hypothetical protein HOV80_33500 [Polyangiaceae bacterium]|nr:hypothetical protein [Polyangiaceae bacterium]
MISRRECAALYEKYAPQIKRRSQLAALVMISVGAMGAMALCFGVAMGERILLLCGLIFVGTVTVLAVGSRPMGRNRMLLVKGRVISLDASTAESGAEAEISVTSVMRFRPDGLVRVLPVPEAPKKIGISDAVYDELRARPGEWDGVELLAGNDWFVLATLDSARRVIGR